MSREPSPPPASDPLKPGPSVPGEASAAGLPVAGPPAQAAAPFVPDAFEEQEEPRPVGEAVNVEAKALPVPNNLAVEEEPRPVLDAVVVQAEARPVLDAIVVEEPGRPGMLPPGQPAVRSGGGAVPDGSLTAEPVTLLGWLEAPPAQYMVPQRFGMSGILGMMTALALLFALLRRLDAHPTVYLFFGLLGLVIGIAQMLNNARPRVASVVAGTILVPLLTGVVLVGDPADPPPLAILCAMLFAAPCGAFLGYAVGTLAAGVFLLMDKLEGWWTGRLRVVAPEDDRHASAQVPRSEAP